MKNRDYNSRRNAFKRELRAYHDAINRTNRYSLPKIAGKLNIFEADYKDAEDGENDEYEVDRRIPNTGLTVLKRDDLYAIGDMDGKPLTEFKFQFIEGCLGEHDKIVRCITGEGEIEDFDVNTERVVEDAACSCADMGGISAADASCTPADSPIHSEINYSDVRKQLEIPYLCGARVIDIGGNTKRKRKRARRRR